MVDVIFHFAKLCHNQSCKYAKVRLFFSFVTLYIHPYCVLLNMNKTLGCSLVFSATQIECNVYYTCNLEISLRDLEEIQRSEKKMYMFKPHPWDRTTRYNTTTAN